jgi:hypothetical protein
MLHGIFTRGDYARRGSPLGLAAVLTLMLASEVAAAEPESGSDSVLPASFELPPVPSLRLTLPNLMVSSSSSVDQSLFTPTPMQESTALFSMSDYRTMSINAVGSRYLRDSELALRIEGFSWSWGNWRFDSGAEMAPAREGDCVAECRIGGWSSRVRLGYDLGTIGPIRNATPFLEVQRKDAKPGKRAGTGLLRFGMDGAF